MNPNEFRILGPPGTGKTTFLSRQIEKYADQYGPENIVVASYTKAAAAELNRRELPIPHENIGTLHALCYRGLKKYEIAETKAKEFNERYPSDAISVASGNMDEMAVDAVYHSDGDKCLSEYNLWRAKCLDLNTMHKSTIHWMKKWESWKMESGYIDFTDMITITLSMDEPMAGNPRIGIFDECFPENVKITMSDGKQYSIGNIVNNKINGTVLSYNEQTQCVEEKKIVGWHKVPLNNRPILSFAGLQATDDHPIFTKNGYRSLRTIIDSNKMELLYLNYENLQRQQAIKSSGKVDYSGVASWRWFVSQENDGSLSATVEETPVNNPEFVYCIDVEDNHNFFANNILVHNCQDFNQQQMKLIRHWAKYQDIVMLSGDDDQVLYDFCGASPDAFLDPNIPITNKRVLKQSWRLPKKIHEYSQTWIKNIKNREPKEFLPREEEGEVRHIKSTYRAPEGAIELAARYAQDGKTVMFLTSCGHFLNPIKEKLRAAGLSYWNPYRLTRGDWNPMGNFKKQSANRVSTRERIISFLSDASRTPLGYWTLESLNRWAELLKVQGVFKRGAKDRISALLSSTIPVIGDEKAFYGEIFEPFALQMAMERNVAWFRESLLGTKKHAADYPLSIYQRNGLVALEEKPKIIVGTIHSVKGGEASVTILFPDISLAAAEEYQRNPDPVIRTFYVGMTRAKETLIVCQPCSDMSVKLN